MKQGLNLKQIIGSVFAAAFGVQSGENRQRDFEQGRAQHFIAAGVIFTVLFVASLVGVVNMVVSP